MLGGTLWYYEEDLPKHWWTDRKQKALLFNTIEGAESKALFLVGRDPELLQKIVLYGGEAEEFGLKQEARPSLDKVAEHVAGLFGSLLGGIAGAKTYQDRIGSEARPDRKEDGPEGPRKPDPASNGPPGP